MKYTWLSGALFALPNLVGAFTVVERSVPIGAFRLMSTAGGGWDNTHPSGWDNDDYLDSLGVGGGGADEGYGYGEEATEQRVVPENGLTDEEITMMAMRAARYYNTDAPIEEVYGVPRQGPPQRMDEGEFQ
ncbi:hypothetical protein ACHAW5_005035 [Stephanodiscus triporus]|uniref:PS II complex 12 kDa extrinsic protein n=1 Tax=Stephanodiscus triporus TaxID=2934178 RepID=A0ABD3NN52_9STRA